MNFLKVPRAFVLEGLVSKMTSICLEPPLEKNKQWNDFTKSQSLENFTEKLSYLLGTSAFQITFQNGCFCFFLYCF